MSRPERCFCLPDADRMHDDLASVYEIEIDPWVEDVQRRPARYETVIEEWTVAPSIDHVPPAACIIEDIVDRIYDCGDYDDDGSDTLRGIEEEAELLELAEKLREGIASKMTWYMAGQKVRDHKLAFDEAGEPLLDGEPLYRKAALS